PQLDFDVMDNQIDTVSKAFQATNVACARCHDHKFDAVSMKDYYALLGVLRSSRWVTHTIDPPELHGPALSQLRWIKEEIRGELGKVWLSEARQVGRYLQAAQVQLVNPADAAALVANPNLGGRFGLQAQIVKQADAVALAQGLDAKRLQC